MLFISDEIRYHIYKRVNKKGNGQWNGEKFRGINEKSGKLFFNFRRFCQNFVSE